MVISFGAPFHVSTKFRLSLEVLCDQAAALRRSGSNSPNDADAGSDLLPDLIVRTTDHLSALAGDQRLTAMTWMKEGETLRCVIPTLSPALIAWLVRTVLNEIGKRSETLSKHDCEQFIAFLTKKQGRTCRLVRMHQVSFNRRLNGEFPSRYSTENSLSWAMGPVPIFSTVH